MNRTAFWFVMLGFAALLLFVADMCVGDSSVSWKHLADFLRGTGTDGIAQDIILSIRLPRTVLAVLIGMALPVSGLQMQTVFRNPLADPYLLGVSSGASLGVALFVLGIPLLRLSLSPFWHSVGVVGAAWAGALLVLFCIIVVSRYVRNIFGILILGVMLGYIVGAVIQILQYLSSAEQLKLFFLWSMGTMSGVTAGQLMIMIPLLTVGLLLAVFSIKAMNLLLLGEDYAQTTGLDVRRSRTLIFLSVAMLAGTVTAFCGPIGFLGLAVPHVARMLYGNADHRVLFPGAALLGIVVFLACDVVAKFFLLPVNCVTALLGVPVIVWIIWKNMRYR